MRYLLLRLAPTSSHLACRTGTEASIPGLEALKDDFIAPSSASRQTPTSPFASLNDEEVDPFAGEDMGGGLMVWLLYLRVAERLAYA